MSHLEETEQRAAAYHLDLLGLTWHHPPNGGLRNKAEGGKLKAQGVKRGVPDIMIYDPPPCGGYVGAAIELKRTDGGRVSPEQRDWLKKLAERGWFTCVCKGSGEVIDIVKKLGYGRGHGRKLIFHAKEDTNER